MRCARCSGRVCVDSRTTISYSISRSGYFPKGTNLDGFTEGELDAVARELNDRPRKRLEFQTPNEIIRSVLLR